MKVSQEPIRRLEGFSLISLENPTKARTPVFFNSDMNRSNEWSPDAASTIKSNELARACIRGNIQHIQYKQNLRKIEKEKAVCTYLLTFIWSWSDETTKLSAPRKTKSFLFLGNACAENGHFQPESFAKLHCHVNKTTKPNDT
ncbi:hypothetical protein PanWU01x14_295540 [Parasponia andersonii]|uniref:Uncharacterized protein n=1 Tax=Parasponia andersonii TaxID=3476 RepID=A0A2P5AVT5_PARAD|nr:hypothetical protein PanWU01x14_295540 [Parasponia andersonii]